MRQNKLILVLGLLAVSIGIKATDNAHYFKSASLHRNPSTSWFDDEHYYEIEDWLLKINRSVLYGNATSGWDKDGNKTNILNDTGAYDMREMFQNVNLATVAQPYLGIVQNVKGIVVNDPNDCKIEFSGKFETWESNCQIRKNLKWGFFLESRIPVREVRIKNVSYADKTTGLAGIAQAQWLQLIKNFDGVLNEFGYKPHAIEFSKSGVGDISFLVGWEDIYERQDDDGSDVMTFWVSARAGVLCPTGERIKTDYIFAMPTGYNDHWGFTGSLELDMGLLPWLSIDLFTGFTWFFDDNHREVRMKTSASQVGHIILEKGIAEEDKGTLWYLGGNVKFDHFWEGLSAIVGYSYNRQENDELSPSDTTLFPKDVVNTHSRLDGWYTHVLHFMLDYDISVHMSATTKWAPTINVFYDYPLDGKNSYKTDMIGAGVGFDVKW